MMFNTDGMPYNVGEWLHDGDEEEAMGFVDKFIRDNSSIIGPHLADSGFTVREAFVNGMIGGVMLVQAGINKKEAHNEPT